MNRFRILMNGLLLGTLLGGCALIMPAPLPEGKMNSEAVKTLFTGKSVESELVRTGRVSLTYYGADGQLRQLQNGEKRGGTWMVRGDGRICLQFEGEKHLCRIIVKEGDGYAKYVVKRDGNHERIITYRSFKDGNLVDN